MRIDRWKRAAISAFSAIGLALLCGCAGEPCILDESEATWQLSPTGQAVALVDPVAYGHLLGRGNIRSSHVQCIVEEFLGRFKSDAEAIVLIHDVEGHLYALNRLLIERGLDPITGSAGGRLNLPPAPSDIYATVNALPQPAKGGYNFRLRALESGVGWVPGGDSSWVPANLRGYLFLPERQELAEGKFLHEFAHFWAAHLAGPPVLTRQIEETEGECHWGYTSVGGVLGGWLPDTLERLGEHLYRGRIAPDGWARNDIQYAPLELYLMGLAEAEEVPPIEIAIGADSVELSNEGLGTFSVSSFESVTIDDIVKANGPRIPASSESNKHFRLALIILTDHELSDAEWDFYSRSVDFASAAESRDVLAFFPEETYPEYYHLLSAIQNSSSGTDYVDRDPGEYLLNFYMATGGRGTIEFIQIATK